MSDEPYEQCGPDEAIKVLSKVGPMFDAFYVQIPKGQESLYVSTMATLTIMNMCSNDPTGEAVKLFLERAIGDIHNFRRMAAESRSGPH